MHDETVKFVWNISHSKKKWAKYDKNVYWSSCKVPDCNEPWILSTYLLETIKYQISCKSFYWEPSCSTRADGRIDMMKLISRFPQFCEKRRKNEVSSVAFPSFRMVSIAEASMVCDSSRTYGGTSRFWQKQTLSATLASSQQGAEAITRSRRHRGR